MNDSKARCHGCGNTTDRPGGLCAYCRAAVIHLRPMREQFDSNVALTRLRHLVAEWTEHGLTARQVDEMVSMTAELDHQLKEYGYLPDDWDPDSMRDGWDETPVPRAVTDVRSDLL